VCATCGHCLPTSQTTQSSTLPSEILPGFLFLGSYDDSAKGELLKAMGVGFVLNCVARCQSLYVNTFSYFRVTDSPPPLRECLRHLDGIRERKGRILVHCMSGLDVAPTVVVAYLMHHLGWGLQASIAWVQERRPCIQLKPDSLDRLQAFDAELGPRECQSPPGGGETTMPGTPSFPMLFASRSVPKSGDGRG